MIWEKIQWFFYWICIKCGFKRERAVRSEPKTELERIYRNHQEEEMKWLEGDRSLPPPPPFDYDKYGVKFTKFIKVMERKKYWFWPF